MSADFPLKSDLPIEDQLEIDRILAIDEDKRLEEEQAFLDARQIYLDNEILTVSMRKGNRNPNAEGATATINFTDIPTDGEIVTIGDDVYEFDDTESPSIVEGHILVSIFGAEDVNDVSVSLTTAIQGQSESGLVTANDDSGSVEVTALAPGSGGNSIAVSTDCVDAAWETDTLTGGEDAVSASKGTFYLFEGQYKLFMAMENITDISSQSWALIYND